MRSVSRFRSASVRCCPVCRRDAVGSQDECCSPICSERLDDARTSIGWIRVQTTDLRADLYELEENLGRVQLKLEKVERLFARLDTGWWRAVGRGAFAKANAIGTLARATEKRLRRLAKLHRPLEKKWKVLKPKVVESERELEELETILRQSC